MYVLHHIQVHSQSFNQTRLLERNAFCLLTTLITLHAIKFPSFQRKKILFPVLPSIVASTMILCACSFVLYILVNISMTDDKVHQKPYRGYASRSTERGLCLTNMVHTHACAHTHTHTHFQHGNSL